MTIIIKSIIVGKHGPDPNAPTPAWEMLLPGHLDVVSYLADDPRTLNLGISRPFAASAL